MAQGTHSQIAAIMIITIAIILAILATAHIITPAQYGVTNNATLTQRITYSFIHANLLHAMINSYVLLSIVFTVRLHIATLIISLLIAIAIPTCCLSTTPTVGLSVGIYALFGIITLKTKRKTLFIATITLYLILAFLMHSVNAAAHTYAYITGITLQLLNTPLLCSKR